MPTSRRLITGSGSAAGIRDLGLLARSFVWPFIWPKGILLYAGVWLMYCVGWALMNWMLTSEFVRKTQLEADQIAARQIQQTLQPENWKSCRATMWRRIYKPLREVGGDYFDVIELAGNRTLFAVADVSGKGMPAALLAANIQALVRSIAMLKRTPWRWPGRLTNT